MQTVSSRDTVTSMIKSIRHAGLQRFFETGSKTGIQPHHAARLARQPNKLDAVSRPADMNVPGWKLHVPSTGHLSAWVNGNWRMTFTFGGEDAIFVDYLDYYSKSYQWHACTTHHTRPPSCARIYCQRSVSRSGKLRGNWGFLARPFRGPSTSVRAFQSIRRGASKRDSDQRTAVAQRLGSRCRLTPTCGGSTNPRLFTM